MTEQQYKFIIKQIIDNGYPKLNKTEKEIYKQAVDKTKNYDELLVVINNIIQLSNSKWTIGGEERPWENSKILLIQMN